MGLGKTVQTIGLFAHLIEAKRNAGPFMVTVPLSTMSNWANEFARWTPGIRVVQFKGAGVVSPSSLFFGPKGSLLATPGLYEYQVGSGGSEGSGGSGR